jgi:hypothetical protein
VRSGYEESGAKSKVGKEEERCEVSSSYSGVDFDTKFYKNGNGKMGVRVSFLNGEGLVEAVERGRESKVKFRDKKREGAFISKRGFL